MGASTNIRVNRRKKNKRSTTLDPSQNLAAYKASSLSPCPLGKRLKSKDKLGRMAKSRSPSGVKPKDIKTTKSRKKAQRRRATSDAPRIGVSRSMLIELDGLDRLGPIDDNVRIKKKTKKSKKFQSQTPGTKQFGVYNIENNDDPFGQKKKLKKKGKSKKGSMTPKVSLSTNVEATIFSSDDELNGHQQQTPCSNNKDKENECNNKGSSCNVIKLTDSKSVTQASKHLNSTTSSIKKAINDNFEQFHQALDDQENKLLDDLELKYEDKKDELDDVEKSLYENAKKSKNVKPRIYEFDANINFVMNKPKILQQIERYGYIEGIGGPEMRSNHSKNSESVIIHDTDSKQVMEQELDDEDVSNSMAFKQKLILGEIQQKTMKKLDVVILMEKEAKIKAKQAADLTKEVDESLKYIDERTKEINEKLAAAKPELDKARAAVSGIEPKEINEIKSLKSPPIVIENVITATVMILGHNIKTWRDVQKLLSYKFKPQLLNFDTYTLTKATRQKVYKKYAAKEDFNYERVYEGSKCCGNLVLWVISQINYSRVLDVIIPLEKELKKLKKDCRKKQKLAKVLMNVVNDLNENIKLYTNQCNQMIDHIIKSTDYELKQFSDKLQPLNEKFYALMNRKID